jgi:glutamate N-acetyltransferase/amino-acid N-acetyltransferase
MQIINDGSITSPKGFRAGAVSAGIKKTGAPDLVLVVSDVSCACAAMFTTNLVSAAPVQICREHLATHGDRIQAIVVNSGNANAVTGQQGVNNAATMTHQTSNLLDLDERQTMVMSTGVIGVQLPMEKVRAGIDAALKALTYDGGHAAARGIMTTDTKPKEFAVMFDGVTIGGMCKGAGMIHPNMATMLAVITTDAKVDRSTLQTALRQAVNVSFNRISVDGDTSTNDTVLCLANGMSGVTPDLQKFQAALNRVCMELAQQIVRDGEGATKFVTLIVSGARTEKDAHQIANTIATSLLTKTAIYGRDANWGRILAAAGRSGVSFDPTKASLRMGPLQLLMDGVPQPFSEEEALKLLSESDVEFELTLREGDASATMWTCDLSHDYVTINAAYRT